MGFIESLQYEGGTGWVNKLCPGPLISFWCFGNFGCFLRWVSLSNCHAKGRWVGWVDKLTPSQSVNSADVIS